MSHPTNEPRSPRHLIGTKWTATRVEEKRLHWEVIHFSPSTGECTLEAVIDKERICLPWRALRDRSLWLPGWQKPQEPESPGEP